MGATPELQKAPASDEPQSRAEMHRRKRVPARIDASRKTRESAALRLLSAERSDEIFPILLEEIVGCGFPRALILQVNFETGELAPRAALNCAKNFHQQLSSCLCATENPLVAALMSLPP